jgi:hypothetical protein
MNTTENQSDVLYTVVCNGVEYKTKFKVGDRVKTKWNTEPVIIEGVNEFDTMFLKRLYWSVVDESYVLGKSKTTYADPVGDNEIDFC